MADSGDAERFASTEAYYAEYRPDYPAAAVRELAARFGLDDEARVLDLGCGAGQLAVPFATHAGEVVGMDPNPTMLEYAAERAADAGVENVKWVEGSDADLDESLAPLRLTTMGRAFHWMEQEQTLATLDEITELGGGVALFSDSEWFTRGTAPWQDAVYAVVSEFLDDLPERTGPVTHERTWADVLSESAFDEVTERRYEYERTWTADEVVGYVFSLSFCSPATFGAEKAAFERALRERLAELDRPLGEAGTCLVTSGRR